MVDEDADTAGIQNDAWSLDLDIDGVGDAVYEATTVTASSISWTVTADCRSCRLLLKLMISLSTLITTDNGDGTNPMGDGSYTYDVTISYLDAGTDGADAGAAAGSLALTSGGAAGGFTLNGSSTEINNYPLSTAVDHFVWVTNEGAGRWWYLRHGYRWNWCSSDDLL